MVVGLISFQVKHFFLVPFSMMKWGYDFSVSSIRSPENVSSLVLTFFQEFSVSITEDFIEHLSEGALAIEVYGHKMNDPRRNPALWDLGIIQAKTRSLRDRWILDILLIPFIIFTKLLEVNTAISKGHAFLSITNILGVGWCYIRDINGTAKLP